MYQSDMARHAHFKSKHKPLNFRCTAQTPNGVVCGKLYPTNAILQHHIRKSHTPMKDKPHGCPYPECNMRFTYLYHLHAHELVHARNEAKLHVPKTPNFSLSVTEDARDQIIEDMNNLRDEERTRRSLFKEQNGTLNGYTFEFSESLKLQVQSYNEQQRRKWKITNRFISAILTSIYNYSQVSGQLRCVELELRQRKKLPRTCCRFYRRS